MSKIPIKKAWKIVGLKLGSFLVRGGERRSNINEQHVPCIINTTTTDN